MTDQTCVDAYLAACEAAAASVGLEHLEIDGQPLWSAEVLRTAVLPDSSSCSSSEKLASTRITCSDTADTDATALLLRFA